MTEPFRTPYPGYDVLDKWDTLSWNDQTREVIAHRLTEVPPRRFFSPAEWVVLSALCDCVMPQHDRTAPVPIAPWIDAELLDKLGSGTRYADAPEAGAAWKRGLAALDAEAQTRHGKKFAALSSDGQAAILKDVDAEKVSGEAWSGLPPKRFFRDLVLKAIVAIYYVHPDGQSEIGYGGPASPRGYVRLEQDRRDSWEAPRGSWTEEQA
ncbi:MAG: gluconate 2-dehydrogenase subunit 3 family protein [Methylobacterium mesophilicum]|nr:gluconate 2-dehydrogenase subunit 3 family protein [Methylobacterium mesophilicum]